MASLRFAALLAAVLLLHLAAAWVTPLWPRFVDPFLVLVVWWALGGSSLGGMLAGLAAGLVKDTLSGGLYGLHGFADTIIGYAAARAGQRLVIQQATGLISVVALASLLEQGILLLLALLLGGAEPPSPLWAAAKAAGSGVAALAVIAAGRFLTAARERHRRRRLAKLR